MDYYYFVVIFFLTIPKHPCYNNKENSKSEGTDDAGYGNATNAEEHNSQNQSGILFPVAEEISRTETDLIAMIKTTGKEIDYELIGYILNVNTQYTQVLMELNENGAMDAVYTYGVSRLTEERFTGESNFYLYDPAGNVAGITDQDGYLWQSYRYDAFGNATFGSPQYDNEYTFNGESYNPNIWSQYLRARYYDMVKGYFLTEDSYLGDIRKPLTLNRYSYCIGNPLFYSDPSGHWGVDLAALESEMMNVLNERDRRLTDVTDMIYDKTGEILGTNNETEVAQIVSGFVAGFAGSFYETFDLITHPEIILANVFEAVTHPIETVAGIIKNKYTKGFDVILQYLVEENYRMVGQEAGRMAGEKVQDLIAAAVVAQVLQTCGDGESGGGTPSKSGLPDAELPEVEGKRPLLKYNMQFFAKDGESSIESGTSSGNRSANLSPEGAGRNGAFREAKRKNNIPVSEQPQNVKPNVDRRGKKQPGKIYEFENGIEIRDAAAGHLFEDDPFQNRGPYFNDPGGNHFDY